MRKRYKSKLEIKVVFYRIIFVLGLFSFWTTDALARGGGGGSGGGGGGGGGSGGGGSSCPLTMNDWYSIACGSAYAIVTLTVIIGLIASWYINKKRIKKVEELVKKASSLDSSWDEVALKNRVSDVFLRFQKDWSEFNVDGMKEYLTENYYKRMVLEMNVLKNENRQNTMDAVLINSLVLWNVDDELDNTKDNFIAQIGASAIDCLIDTTNGQQLYADLNPFVEYWGFAREGGEWKLNLIRQATENRQMIENDIVDFAKRNNFYYDPDFGWLMMPNHGVIFRQNNFTTSDINNHVIGYFRDKIVEFYTFIGNTQSNFPKNYLVAQVVLPIQYKDILVRRKRLLFNFTPSGLRRIHTESNDFNKKFCLWADPADQVSSFELLSPNFMEKIYDLPFELNIEIVGNFLYFYAKKRANINYDKMLEILSWAFNEMKI